jgi:myotubularin-related protein 6/7/8
MDAIRVAKVERVQLDRFIPSTQASKPVTRQRLTITLHLTPHHLIFSPLPEYSDLTRSKSILDPRNETDEIWVPYPSITLLTRLPQTIHGLYPLQIRTRNFESYVLSFEKDREGGAEDVWQSVKDCAVSGKLTPELQTQVTLTMKASVEQLYAFNYDLPSASTSKAALAPPSRAARIVSSPLSTRYDNELEDTPSSSSELPAPNGWAVYNPRTEFTRQGVGSRTRGWRFTDINKDYGFSPTYPAKLVVPSRIGDAVLQYAAKYRSKARIPALTYLHWANNVSSTPKWEVTIADEQASITRSSQPMVGLKGARSAQDERLVECIFSSHQSPEDTYTSPSPPIQATPQVYGSTSTNMIIDARPTTNAMANVAMGAGTENMEHYKFGKKAYLGIDNIHVMRKSLHTITEAIAEAETSGAIDRSMLRKSNWLRHISTIMDGSLVIIRNIHLNASHVLVHCSDGWDRTAQLAALAQICLDPYYRTIDGLKVLIGKDWVSFGHKFLDRSGHLSSEKHFTVTEPEEESDEEGGGGGGASKAAQAFFASVQKQFTSNNSHQKEVSPVFHQFLDCIRQIQRQSPDRFEYNEQYLLDLHYHLYSCQFGTMLFNTERERRVPPSVTNKAYCERTVSLWDWIDLDRSKYINDTFNPALDDRESRDPNADQGVLLPDPKDVRFWHGLFRRGDEEMNGSKIALAQAQGAEVLTVQAGQIDPGTPDALLHPTENPLAAPQPPRTLTPVPRIQGQATSRPHTPPVSPPPKSARLPTAGGGWGWSQLSNGAFNALSVAGNQIKTISTEAMAQIRAEANEGRELGGLRGETNGYDQYGQGQAAVQGRERQQRVKGIRLPSEANPWDDKPSFLGPVVPPKDVPSSSRPNPNAWDVDPWGNKVGTEVASTPTPLSLDRLSLMDDHGPSRSRGVSPKHTIPPAVKETRTQEERDLEAAALGGDQKAWDPLGAL